MSEEASRTEAPILEQPETPAPQAAGAEAAAPEKAEGESFRSRLNDNIYYALTNAGYALFKTLFRADVRGMDEFAGAGGAKPAPKDVPSVIIANHMSHADPLFIAAMLPRMKKKPAFVMHKAVYSAVMNYKIPLLPKLRILSRIPLVSKVAPLWFKLSETVGVKVGRAILKRADILPVDINNPMAIKAMRDRIEKGQSVVIFPEGQRTTTGTLEKVFNGAALVAQKTGAPVVPIYLEGLQFMAVGTEQLPLHPKQWFPKLRMTVFPSREIKAPEGNSGKSKKEKEELRRSLQRDIERIVQEMPVNAIDDDKTLMDGLHEAALAYGPDTIVYREPVMASDKTGLSEEERLRVEQEELQNSRLSYQKLLEASYALGDRIAERTEAGENVGYLLPTSLAGVKTFWAMQAYKRVPALFNTTATQAQMESYVRTASLKTIVTSRTFIEKAKLQDKADALSKVCRILYLEDLKKEIEAFSLAKKLEIGEFAQGVRRPACTEIAAEKGKRGDEPAVIPFTSGSTGLPKGVVLSSTNILTNVEQIGAVVPLIPGKKIFNAMPLFHSSGLVAAMIAPAMKGMPTMLCPSPLLKQIPGLVYDFGADMTFATPTFLRLWARNDSDRALRVLKEVYSGAERLDDETAKLCYERYGIRIESGYGTTESSPTVSMNTKSGGKPGSVGRFLPGIEVKFEPVPGLARGGKISIKGRNIMKGYLMPDDENPGTVHAPADGWYDTGDIGYVDDEGFLFLTGRLKRCAKIGGEMVPLDPIEDAAKKASLKEEFEHATILGADETGADKIVLITTDPDLTAKALSQAAKEIGVADLGLPKKDAIFVIGQMMKLGNGKRDYVGLKEWYQQKAKGGDETAAPPPVVADSAPQPPTVH